MMYREGRAEQPSTMGQSRAALCDVQSRQSRASFCDVQSSPLRYGRAEQAFTMCRAALCDVKSRQNKIALCDVADQAEQIDVVEQSSVMLQSSSTTEQQSNPSIFCFVISLNLLLFCRFGFYFPFSCFYQNHSFWLF